MDRQLVCVHEAAHVVAGIALGLAVGPARVWQDEAGCWQGNVTMLDRPTPVQTAVIAAAGEEAVRIALRDQGTAFSEELETTFAHDHDRLAGTGLCEAELAEAKMVAYEGVLRSWPEIRWLAERL